MKKVSLIIAFSFSFFTVINAQSAKTVYAEIGGPGLASANFDMRFANREDGFGFRAGVGGFSLSDDFDNSRVTLITVPIGLNYLIGKDQKNYFEIGAGFTYISANSKDDFGSDNFRSSFGNLTLGYRLAPARGGFMFKAQITPVFGNGFFIPYYGGIGFGYKF